MSNPAASPPSVSPSVSPIAEAPEATRDAARYWKCLAIEAIRFLDADQIATATKRAGVEAHICGAPASLAQPAGDELDDELQKIAFAAHTCEIVGERENDAAPDWFNAGFLKAEVAPRLRKYADLLVRAQRSEDSRALLRDVASSGVELRYVLAALSKETASV